MNTLEQWMALEENDIAQAAQSITKEDLPQLIEPLSQKEDKTRYRALQLLLACSAYCDLVYPYWDVFRAKLHHENSYQRSIGALLLAGNAKWDTEHRMDQAIGEYLALLHDEKPITIRQCIQALEQVLVHHPELGPAVADALMALDLQNIKETMRKLILLDALNILTLIRHQKPNEAIDRYLSDALSGGLLDQKSKRLLEQRIAAV